MNRKISILTVVLLSLNVLLDPIVAISTVYAQESAVETSVSTESVSEETIIEEVPESIPEEVYEEPTVEETLPEEVPAEPESSGEVPEEVQEEPEEVETEESEESEESEEEEKDPVTSISFESAVTDNLYTGSEFEVPVRVVNSEAALEGALLRFTVDSQHIAGYDNNGAYFPYANRAASSVNNSGSNLIIEYDLSDLSQEYNGVTTLSLNTFDNGSMRHGTQIPVKAEVIQNGNIIAQTDYRNYNFVTRQPRLTTSVAYSEEGSSSEDDDEGPAQQTEIAYNLSFENIGSGNGSGQSTVTDITVSTTIPSSLSFDSSLNDGWSYNEGTRVATYSVTPESTIYSNGLNLPTNLTLTSADTSEEVSEAVYAEAVFTFANGDVITKTNQPEVTMLAVSEEVSLFAAIDANLTTGFELSYLDKDGNLVSIENGSNIEVDLNDMNAVSMVYEITIPNDMDIVGGDTYSMPYPAIATIGNATDQPIIVGGVEVATYSIIGEEVVITFNDAVSGLDDVSLNVNIKTQFNTEIFETTEEVVVEVPYSDGTSYTVMVRAEQQEYEGTDLKEAGFGYILDGESKVSVDRNPEFVDWTVRANDSMGSFENATIIDQFGEGLSIVDGSFVVERIIRNHNNEEIGRESVTDFSVTTTETGFELGLGSIEDAYDITYSTTVNRPEGGGTHTFNNNAIINLDGDQTTVNDDFTGTWSGDLPIITKNGNLVSGKSDRIAWQVEYNYGKESLGSVTLTDSLSHGEIDLNKIVVYEVDTDIDGNVISRNEITVSPVVGEDGAVSFPGLDAEGKAYLIEFQSIVPIGLNDTVTNTITDDLPQPNSDNASVTVNTIPTGGKVGEQLVDDQGRPYIKWVITMNSQRVDISTINIKDVFNGEYLTFDIKDTKLFEDGVEVSNYNVQNYTHPDGRSGFDLSVTEAGPHEYKFEYITYYTTLGMQQPEIANDAELIFDEGTGIGIGVDIGFNQVGPKAGIDKKGKYVLNETGIQEIEWVVAFNNSRILLENPKIEDVFTSENISYVDGSLVVTENGEPFNDYVFNKTDNGFKLDINKNTNARYVLTYRTTADDDKNLMQRNDATVIWQGGEESAGYELGKRDPGVNKKGEVTINEDGSKTVNWTIDFNTNSNVIHNFKLTDTNLPSTVTISDIKVTSGESDVTGQFTISEPSGGVFTISTGRLNAAPYQLTYSTTLSPEEEIQEVKNTAVAEYLGGSQTAEGTIPKPGLGVQKDAISIDKSTDPARINWKITANTDGNLVNLQNAVLTDTIPADQRLVAGTINVERVGGGNVTGESVIDDTQKNTFTVGLPNGAYQYIVTFQTEILEYPSANEKLDRYTNEVELSNTGHDPVKDGAYIDYFADGTNNNNGKTGTVNDDTENVDWKLTVNPLGLPINNAKISDTLSQNHTYVENSIVLLDASGNPLSDYKIDVADDNRSFTIDLGNINESYSVRYSTRLNPNLIGFYNISNTVKLTGGTDSKVLSSTTETVLTQQWFYGGGGSGRTLDLNFKKVDADNNEPIEGVAFKLQRLNNSGSTVHVADFVTKADGTQQLLEQRAGRFILTEISTLPDYVAGPPLYFVYSYGESGEVTIDMADSSWNPANFQRVEGASLVIQNEKQKTSVTANKAWEGAPNNKPTVYFQLYRHVGEGEAEPVPEADIKELPSGTTSVTWGNLVAKDTTGADYIFTVREVDADGNDFVPEGYTKSENGLTVTNTAIPTEISVRKAWDDANNQDDLRPDSVEVQLTANGDSYGEPVELNAGNDWTHTFGDLPVYGNGEQINYSVQENNLPEGYEPSVSVDEDGVLVLTNTHVPATTELTVNKLWDDADNQDGLRPTSVTVQLMADGEALGDPVELNAENAWAQTWTNLPVNAAGTAIEYTVEETTIPEGYEATQEVVEGVIVITNAHTPAVKDVPVNKVWDDADNQDGIRPNSITANLLADGTHIDSVELSEANEWSHVFEGLPVFENGVEITYTITEDTVTDYSTEIVEGVITNSYTPEETSVTVTKEWQDGNNQDGNRPESIQVQLTADGVALEGQTAELNAENNWTASWSGLPLNADGTAIVYSVVESNVPEEYTVEVNDADHGNIILTNSYTPEVTDLKVNKVWNDEENRDGLRPESIEVQLVADDQNQGEPVVLDEANNWSYTWTDLAVNTAGEAIAYTVAEVNLPEGYTSTISDVEDNTITVTNSHDVAVNDINVRKVWDDANNQDGNRPESIEVQLTANGELYGEPVELNADNDWVYAWTDLKVNEAGAAINYAVSETNVPEDYEVVVNAEDPTNVVITNSYTPKVTQVAVEKAWNDADNQDGQRPTNVIVQLFADGEALGEPVELNAENAWAQTWTELPVNVSGTAIEYTVEETTIPEGYEATQEVVEGVNVITNTHTPAVTDIPVSKVWDDADNQDGLRPESITANLLADGEVVDTVELNDANDWATVFENLPVYNNGEEITYTITEDAVENYSTEIVESVITNRYTPEETSVTVTKDWQDGNNQDGNRPDSIQVQLTADGEALEGQTAELNTENNWTASWSGLPLKADGTEIKYSVVESNVPEEFTVEVNDADRGNIILTNTYTPEVTDLTVNKVWNDEKNRDGLRSETIEVQLVADGQNQGEPIVLDEANNWSYTWTDLAVNTAGEAIAYTVAELNVPEGYTSTISDVEDNTITVTNTHDVAVNEINVRKVWNDANNQDGLRPTNVTVQLIADGEALGDPIELNGENAWAYSWTNLPVNASGTAIEYTVEETTVTEGYEATQEVVEGVNVITNTHTPAVTDIPVSKVWDDADNQDGLRPESITANLLADGTPIDAVELSEANEWSHVFEGLPVFENGEEITYTITEDTVTDYSTDIVDGVITNSYTPEETSVTVTKDWQDGNNQDGNRPDSIQVQLTADGEALEGQTAELNAENNWTASWSGLPLNIDGKAIEYSVVEINTPEGYEVTVNNDNHGNIILTNTYSPEVRDLTVNKVWNDEENRDGIRPDSIEVQLVANGQNQGETVVLDEANNWSYTWTNLAVNATGEAITYTVTEVSVPEGYETTTELVDGVVVITNTHKPSDPTPDPSVSVNLQALKELEGRELKANEFKFVVIQNGNVIGTANNAADGSVQFSSIRFTEAGTYEYTIRELQGNDDEVTYDNTEYKVAVEVISEGDELIANITYRTANGDIPVFVNTVDPDEPGTPEDPKKPGTPGDPGTPSDSGDSDLPATGEESFMWFGVVTLLIGVGFLFSVQSRPKKKK